MEFCSGYLIKLLKHSVIGIFNENKEEYNVKTSENENKEEYNVKTSENYVKYSSFNMGEMHKSQELYSREGDNSS